MDVGLTRLIDEAAVAHLGRPGPGGAEPTAPGDPLRPDPATPEGLRAARRQLSWRPPDPRAVERTLVAGGRSVPARIIDPTAGDARGVYLQIHGGGFPGGWSNRPETRSGQHGW